MNRKDGNTVGIGAKGVRMLKKIEMDKYGPFLALLVLFAISALASPYFLRIRNLTNILRQVSYTGIIGLGMTFVIISGGIDLSVGSMLALVGGIAIMLLNYLGGGVGAIAAVFFGAIVVGAAAGATKPATKQHRSQQKNPHHQNAFHRFGYDSGFRWIIPFARCSFDPRPFFKT